ncbi:hypothetical protein NA57DRAFT_59200 [Rhizodiscina lignyota]|uniref:Uncharacterized protein n=1 Tax=Rhizodiscina lignyota TaxID=1504668 RepID=A0A9P4IAJ3_9PEZI|nr:hypothetical protein NA57DRAFT_59200 [Rhizodiscina lignyota]
MAVSLPPHIQQWTMQVLGKEVFGSTRVTRAERSNSGSTSPDFDNDYKFDLANEEIYQTADEKEIEIDYQERYLSSEEDLSPMEEFDDNESFHSFDNEEEIIESEESDDDDFDEEKAIEAYAAQEWKADVTATVVSFYTGRAKVVEVLPSPASSPTTSQIPSRDASLVKTGNNRARPRPLISNNRVTRLSSDSTPQMSLPPRESSLENANSFSNRMSNVRNEPQRSSIYTINTATTSPPRFFHNNRRASVADPAALAHEPFWPLMPDRPVTPATPTTPTAETPRKPRHGRLKSLSRLGLFKSATKSRADGLRSTSSTHLPYTAPPMPSYPAPPPPIPAPLTRGTFAPAPFVRPQTAKLVARGADERDSGISEVAAMLGGRRKGRGAGSDGDDEVTDGEGIVRERRASRQKLRKRKSVYGLD